MLELIKKYKRIILYLVFGALTTAINTVMYIVFSKLLGVGYIESNVIAWILSVLFAYATNKILVFESKGMSITLIMREISLFVGYRLFSGLIDTTLMYVMIDLLKFNDIVTKVMVNVIVIILNYVFSKLIIFKYKSNR